MWIHLTYEVFGGRIVGHTTWITDESEIEEIVHRYKGQLLTIEKDDTNEV